MQTEATPQQSQQHGWQGQEAGRQTQHRNLHPPMQRQTHPNYAQAVRPPQMGYQQQQQQRRQQQQQQQQHRYTPHMKQAQRQYGREDAQVTQQHKVQRSGPPHLMQQLDPGGTLPGREGKSQSLSQRAPHIQQQNWIQTQTEAESVPLDTGDK